MRPDGLIHFIILVGGIQGAILGLLHVLRVSPTWVRFLGWAFATHALTDIYLWIYWTGTPDSLRLLRLLPLNVVLIPVYFLFRYVQCFTGSSHVHRKFSRLLALMAIAEVVAYLMPAGAALYENTIDQSILSFSKWVRTMLNIISLPIFVLTSYYIYHLIREYQLVISQYPLRRYQLIWLYQILVGMCLIYSLAQLPLLVWLLVNWQSRALYYPFGLVSSAFMVVAGFRAFAIHDRLQLEVSVTPETAAPLTSAQEALYQQAIQLIQHDQLYRIPTLKLADVAERLSVSPHYLSRIVNQQAQKGFTDLINEYRVNEIKRLMTDPNFTHYTLEGLGQEAGFGAKSTYQASFKRLTGLTPSQYRASVRPVS